jgi:hypothetical protein
MSQWRVGEPSIRSGGGDGGFVMVCNVKKPKQKKPVLVKSSDRHKPSKYGDSGKYKYGDFGSAKAGFLRDGVMATFHNAVKASEHEGSAAAAADTAAVPAVASPSQPHHAELLAGYTEYSLGAVTVKLARQHGRKSREYRRAYANPEDPQSKAAVEKLVKESKAHRNTFDQEVKYLRESLAAAEAETEVV